MRAHAPLALAAFIAAPIWTATEAAAYVVQPLSVAMSPSGKGSSARVNITSGDPGPIDLEITPQRVSIDEDGNREFSPEPAAFLLFPPQTTLKPDSSQAVAVRYVGSPSIKTGAVYNLLVSQTNVAEAPQDSSGFGVVLAYNVTVVVNPPDARSDVKLEGAPKKSEDGAVVTVRNSGNAVADLSAYSWTYSIGGKPVTLKPEDLKFGGTRFLEPGKARRVMVLNMPEGAALALAPAQ